MTLGSGLLTWESSLSVSSSSVDILAHLLKHWLLKSTLFLLPFLWFLLDLWKWSLGWLMGSALPKVCVEDKSSFSCRPFEMGLELNVSCLPCAEDQAAYSYYDSAEYPVTSPAGASLLKCTFEQTDPNIVLTLDLCWASSNPDPQSLPQWDLVHG